MYAEKIIVKVDFLLLDARKSVVIIVSYCNCIVNTINGWNGLVFGLTQVHIMVCDSDDVNIRQITHLVDVFRLCNSPVIFISIIFATGRVSIQTTLTRLIVRNCNIINIIMDVISNFYQLICVMMGNCGPGV